MKKIISSLFVGAIGGAFALVGNYYFDQPNFNQVTNYNPYATPAKLANYSALTASANAPDFVASAEKSIHSVVHIKTIVEQKNNLAYDPFQDWLFGGRQRQPNMMQGSGSGVIISQDGYIVTNNHVVNDATKIEVVLNDKRTYSAEVIGTDPNTDLALLKIKEKELPFVNYGNSDDVKVGEWVLAVGNPFNLNSTVTAGIVSAKGRNINILEHNAQGGSLAPIESFIQTDAAVNPGNSGGALVSTTGDLVGINTAIASNNGSYQGYSFAIPVNIVKKVVSDLIEYGTVQRAFIGLSIQDIDSKFAEEKRIKQLKGIYINGLTQNGAGEEAGIKVGDVVTKIENVTVKSTSELLEQVGKFRPSDKISVTVIRNEKEVILPVVLKNKENSLGIIKKPEIVRTSVNSLGAEFEELNAEDLVKYNINAGVKISKMMPGKLANAGIKEGFIITSVVKKKVSNIKDIQTMLETKTGGVLIEGMYPNGMRAYYGFGL
ncbi:MAG: trypsin-like peptidase domain-containing protein [Burkholderiales bacterium]|nr:trypsin-like peptidase domain-containing protein [Bacteroidia bacterium]